MSVAGLHERVSEVAVSAEAARPVGVVGAVVSEDAAVVADKGADSAEALPAASTAETVKEYVVAAERPVIEADVPLGEAASVPLRYTR